MKRPFIFSLGLQGENLATQFQPRHLLDLLEIIFHQFRSVANIHKIVLQNLQRIIVSKQSYINNTELNDIRKLFV